MENTPAAAPAAPLSPVMNAWMPDGTAIAIAVASSARTRRTGLQRRVALPPNTGMLFVFPKAGRHAFWMDGTEMDLDILFLRWLGGIPELRAPGSAAMVVRVAHGVAGSLQELWAPEDVWLVLELAAGSGLREGDQIVFDGALPAASS